MTPDPMAHAGELGTDIIYICFIKNLSSCSPRDSATQFVFVMSQGTRHKEEQEFIAGNKRTIWMGSPSLHPKAFTNFKNRARHIKATRYSSQVVPFRPGENYH